MPSSSPTDSETLPDAIVVTLFVDCDCVGGALRYGLLTVIGAMPDVGGETGVQEVRFLPCSQGRVDVSIVLTAYDGAIAVAGALEKRAVRASSCATAFSSDGEVSSVCRARLGCRLHVVSPAASACAPSRPPTCRTASSTRWNVAPLKKVQRSCSC